MADTPVDEFEAQFALNLRPTYLVTQAALPALVDADGGAVVCVSSRSALHPFAGAAGYCASKAAIITFAQVVAREHARRRRALQRGAPADDRHAGQPRVDAAEQHAGLTPPAEIAAVIRFLCGPESAPITGAAIPVYGRP